MATDAGNILSRIKDEEIEWVDLRFTDPKGKWQHLTMVVGHHRRRPADRRLHVRRSSIAGWKAINESDMILKPDLDAVYVDPFSATPMLVLFCNVVEPSTGELYGRDPRSTATRAEAYLKRPASATPSSSVPKPNSSCSTTCASRTATTPAATASTTSSCRPTPAANMRAATSPTVRAPRAAISPSRRSTAPWTSAARWSRR